MREITYRGCSPPDPLDSLHYCVVWGDVGCGIMHTKAAQTVDGLDTVSYTQMPQCNTLAFKFN